MDDCHNGYEVLCHLQGRCGSITSNHSGDAVTVELTPYDLYMGRNTPQKGGPPMPTAAIVAAEPVPAPAPESTNNNRSTMKVRASVKTICEKCRKSAAKGGARHLR